MLLLSFPLRRCILVEMQLSGIQSINEIEDIDFKAHPRLLANLEADTFHLFLAFKRITLFPTPLEAQVSFNFFI